jgi:predicted transcriptional regulator
MASTQIKPGNIEKNIRLGIPRFGDAFVDQVMGWLNGISPMQRARPRGAMTTGGPDALKYSVLVKHIKPKPKLPISIMVKVVNQQQIEKVEKGLLREKLLGPLKAKGPAAAKKYEVTDLGRRFVEKFAQSQQKEK